MYLQESVNLKISQRKFVNVVTTLQSISRNLDKGDSIGPISKRRAPRRQALLSGIAQVRKSSQNLSGP